jgi:hypothetical protein
MMRWKSEHEEIIASEVGEKVEDEDFDWVVVVAAKEVVAVEVVVQGPHLEVGYVASLVGLAEVVFPV